ncbi:MAG: hypothetical protein NVSMB52_05640 [Chloroflexota bacterium]
MLAALRLLWSGTAIPRRGCPVFTWATFVEGNRHRLRIIRVGTGIDERTTVESSKSRVENQTRSMPRTVKCAGDEASSGMDWRLDVEIYK